MTDRHPGNIQGPFTSDPVLTGERTLPGIPEENYWFMRHVAAYRFASALCAGREVLDAGCGEGYGSEILADVASEVVGVDLDAELLNRARGRYVRARFEPADLLALPFPDSSFDVVVTLQVVEHLSSPGGFIAECGRVLRPGGVLVVATPNRLTFSPTGVRNPFHTTEFSAEELRSLLERHARVERVHGVFHGPRIRRLERLHRGSVPEMLIARPAPAWPRWLLRAVTRTTEHDFEIREREIHRALDLIAVATW